MKTETSFTLDDLQSDIIHLTHLLDEIVSKLLEVDSGRIVHDDRKDLDRVTAIAWVARDLIERTEKNISENFQKLRRGS